jgi:hypothetical protein
MLKGQAKKDFEKWVRQAELITDFTFLPWIKDKNLGIQFYSLPFSMQYGVLVDWFDSVGIEIYNLKKMVELFDRVENKCHYIEDLETRPQARQKAIEQANKIYNDRK